MKPNWPLIDPAAMSDPKIRSALAEPSFRAFSQLSQMLGGGLTLNDNQKCSLVWLGETDKGQPALTHGTEYLVADPSFGKPIGFTPLYAEDSDRNSVTIESFKFNKRPTDSTGSPRIGFVGITFWSRLTTGEQIELVRTSNSGNIASGAPTTNIDYSGVCTATSSTDYSTYYTWNGTNQVTVIEAGLYLVRVQASWSSNGTGSRNLDILKSGTAIASSEIQAATPGALGSGTSHEVVHPVWITAGQTISGRVLQQSGGTLTLFGTGSLTADSGRTKMTITRLRNDTTPTARVFGVLWGG